MSCLINNICKHNRVICICYLIWPNIVLFTPTCSRRRQENKWYFAENTLFYGYLVVCGNEPPMYVFYKIAVNVRATKFRVFKRARRCGSSALCEMGLNWMKINFRTNQVWFQRHIFSSTLCPFTFWISCILDKA